MEHERQAAAPTAAADPGGSLFSGSAAGLTPEQRLDQANRPQPAPCVACGAPIPLEWVDGGRLTGGWQRLRYKCEACEGADRRAESSARHQELLRRSGLPARYRGFSLSNLLHQEPGEDWTSFRARLDQVGDRVLGVTEHNRGLITQLRQWNRRGGSVLVKGPVGVGKTTIAAALVDKVCAAGVPVHYTSEADLFERMRAEIRTKQRGPQALDDCRDAGVLVLDDLGRVESLSPWALDGMETLICRRYDAEAPIVITTNLDLEEIGDRYGERVMGRLFQMMGGRQVELAGVDWRTGMLHDPLPEVEAAPDWRERQAGA